MGEDNSDALGQEKILRLRNALSGGKFLTFLLKNKEYGVEILKVQEILGLMPITPVPDSPSFLKGVINLRGKPVPVVDMRAKLDMSGSSLQENACIIVVRTAASQIGFIVDRINEVVNVSETEVDLPSDKDISVRSEYLLGIAKGSDKIRFLLDIDRILSDHDIPVDGKYNESGGQGKA